MQVEYEAPLEYPYFVYGQGWASCSPDKTQQIYGLKTVHRLQVGDIVVSMIPREQAAPPPTSVRGSTIITTATTTAVTARQLASTGNQHPLTEQHTVQSYHMVNSAGHHLVKQHISPVTSSKHMTAVGVHHPVVSQQQQQNHPQPPQSSSPDCVSSKKRRWSAPDQICDEDEQNVKKVKT